MKIIDKYVCFSLQFTFSSIGCINIKSCVKINIPVKPYFCIWVIRVFLILCNDFYRSSKCRISVAIYFAGVLIMVGKTTILTCILNQ